MPKRKVVTMRLSEEDEAGYRKMAELAGIGLSEWMRAALDAYARRGEPKESRQHPAPVHTPKAPSVVHEQKGMSWAEFRRLQEEGK